MGLPYNEVSKEGCPLLQISPQQAAICLTAIGAYRATSNYINIY